MEAFRVIGIDADDEIQTVLVGGTEDGDSDLPEFLAGAAKAALEKARCYHCRCLHYGHRDREEKQ